MVASEKEKKTCEIYLQICVCECNPEARLRQDTLYPLSPVHVFARSVLTKQQGDKVLRQVPSLANSRKTGIGVTALPGRHKAPYCLHLFLQQWGEQMRIWCSLISLFTIKYKQSLMVTKRWDPALPETSPLGSRTERSNITLSCATVLQASSLEFLLI